VAIRPSTRATWADRSVAFVAEGVLSASAGLFMKRLRLQVVGS
jgi:hypothetical protein